MSQRRSDEDEQLISWLTAECRRLEAERDRLIEGCIQETWRRPPRTLANASDDQLDEEHGYQWRFGAMGDFVRRKDQAIQAVRKAAGLEAS